MVRHNEATLRLPIEILLGSVARAEVVEEGSNLSTLLALPCTLLDERAERSSSCTETSHDDGLGVKRRQLTSDAKG